MQYKKVESIYKKPIRNLGRKKVAYIVKNYHRYIDYGNYIKEMQYGRQTDAVATTNIISIKKIIEEFNIKNDYHFLSKTEQDILDIELILLELDIPSTSIAKIISSMLKAEQKTISFILNKISAKYFVSDYYDIEMKRIFPNSYKNLKDKIKGYIE